ncbi:hypothetical protein HPB52_016490 [Rhipicephalus sanguineus]|uniref:Uncharacterized protein n=1 Tax=Rhipicephalus sanguineus TaxID=34632 RepID=A0A9D4PNS1_RHISA|nr:hypothetical protein HPB52_016490 [Rhipicephalus sanguineus]
MAHKKHCNKGLHIGRLEEGVAFEEALPPSVLRCSPQSVGAKHRQRVLAHLRYSHNLQRQRSREPSQGQSLMRREGASSSLDQGSPSATSATDRSSSTTPTLLVEANHFKLDLNKKLVVYHYEVTIWWGAEDPPSETDAKQRLASRDKRRILAEFASSTLDMNNPIFDGQKSLYSIKPLELEGETKIVSVRREICEIRDEFYVRIRQVAMLRYDSQHYSRKQAQALDIAIRCALSHDRDCLGRLLLRKVPKEPAPQKQLTTPQYRTPTVRGRYSQQRGDPPAKTDDAENPGEATYSGILTSVRSGQYEMFVNADTILTSFYEDGPLLNYVEALLGRQLGEHPQLEEAEIKDLNTRLRGFKVCVKHLRYTRSWKIKQITKKGADKIAVTEAQTVAKYFEETYKKLDHPSLPCVEVESKKGKCYYPLEMCFIPLGQRGEQSQSGKPVTPSERFARAKGVARELAVRREDILGEFFTSISTSPVECSAKVFPKVNVDDLKSPMGVVPWTILNMNKFNTVSDVAKLKKNLIAQGIRQGIILDVKAKIANRNNPDLVDILEELKAVEFLVIILDSEKSVYYNKLKNDAETKLGLITQCVAVDKSKFSDGSIGGNLIRKIKAKLGFVDKAMPRTIDGFNCEDALVMGADVSHHGPNDQSPSVAAVVASIDGRASRYVAVMRPQARTDGNTRVEIISKMESMAKELFLHYEEKNPGKIPKDILFYRDGVSEGEIGEVCEKEHKYLQSAFAEVFGCNPRITGTARPAHYRVIYDDNGFEPETLQKITFSLCHMYARCVPVVSIPAPVYYAHLAAARASCYMKATEQVDTNPINVVGNCRDKIFFI